MERDEFLDEFLSKWKRVSERIFNERLEKGEVRVHTEDECFKIALEVIGLDELTNESIENLDEEQKYKKYRELLREFKRIKTRIKAIIEQMKRIERSIPHRTNTSGRYEKQGRA